MLDTNPETDPISVEWKRIREEFARIQAGLKGVEHNPNAGLLRAAVANASGEIDDLQNHVRAYAQMLWGDESSHEQMRAQIENLKRLTQPPQLHATLIGRSTTPDAFVVSVGGQRFDVVCSPSADFTADQLAEGDEVLVTPDNKVIVNRVKPLQRGDAMEVIELLPNPVSHRIERLLVRSGSQDGIIVDTTDSLCQRCKNASDEMPTHPRIGDKVLVDSGARIAFELLPEAKETSEFELESELIETYKSIGGLDEIIETVHDVIELPYLHREAYKTYQMQRPKGILLWGPPGTGKTLLAKAIACELKAGIAKQLNELVDMVENYRTLSQSSLEDFTEAQRTQPQNELTCLEEKFALFKDIAGGQPLDIKQPEETLTRLDEVRHNLRAYFLNIKGPELLSKWVGEAEQKVRQIFATAKRYASYTTPVVIFLDEIESMFQRRGTGISTDLEKTMVPSLLTELDGVVALNDVIVIGASNRHELLDPALLRPGRFDLKIKIDRPDRVAAVSIFSKYLTSELPLSPDGLLTASSDDFIEQISQMIARIRPHASIIVKQGASKTSQYPLSVINGNMVVQITHLLRGNEGQFPTDRHVHFAELAHAIEQVYRDYLQQQLTTSEQQPENQITSVEVVVEMQAAETALTNQELPVLPLAYIPANDTSRSRADLLIDFAVDVIYSSHSYLKARVLAECGSEYTFPLREFVNGAMIKDIVERAKRLALKRQIRTENTQTENVPIGITADDLLAGIRVEFDEDKDRFAMSKPEIADRICDTCHRRHNTAEDYAVEVFLGYNTQNRWVQMRQHHFVH